MTYKRSINKSVLLINLVRASLALSQVLDYVPVVVFCVGVVSLDYELFAYACLWRIAFGIPSSNDALSHVDNVRVDMVRVLGVEIVWMLVVSVAVLV